MLHYTTIIATHYNYAVAKMSVSFTFSPKTVIVYTLMMSKINIDYNDFYINHRKFR